jgi:hypothetical protein
LKSVSLFALLLGALCVGCSNAHPDEPASPAAVTAPSKVGPPSSDSDSPSRVLKTVRGAGRPHVFDRTHVIDLAGHPVSPFGSRAATAVVLIFVCTDCPVANRYAPDLEHLYEAYRGKGVAFWLVYADPGEESAKIRRHLKEYGYQIPALRDSDHQLVRLCGVTKTPESVLFSGAGKQVYRGRIDDRFTDYGKGRGAPSREDLREAIDCVLQGKPVPAATTDVIGCVIPEIRE